MPKQGNKYNVLHLKISLEAAFSTMIWANKKEFIFRQGNCTMNVLHPSLSKSFTLSICSWDPMKNSTLEYYWKSCSHDGSLEDNCCVLFFLLKLFISTLHHIFYSPKPSKIYGESDFVSSVSRNKLGKYTFLWFKKRLLFLMGGKYKWILPKYILSCSRVDIIFLRTFLL